MPKVNICQLRDTWELKAWLHAGKTVELRERDKVIAQIVPEPPQGHGPVQYPDFAARAKATDRILHAVADLIRERGRY